MYINEKNEGEKYIKRPGAYTIITREKDNKIAIIASKDKYFFLGGGIENNETPLEALKRESIEESGYTLKNIIPYKIVNSYESSKSKGPIDVTANVFLAEFDKKVTAPIEKGYNILWVNPEEYVGKMRFYWHNYILNCYIEDKIE